MDGSESRSDWRVILGVGLVLWGGWWLLNGVLAPLFWPLRVVLQWVARIGWPLAIIALGVLLIVMARRDWRPVAGGARVYRSRTERMVGGVLGGIAAYAGVDPTLLRVIYVILLFLTGFGLGLIFYVIAMVVIPEESAVASGDDPPAAPPIPASPVTPGPAPTPPAPGAPVAPPVPPAPSQTGATS